MGLSVFIGIWVGSYLDRKLDTAPVLFWIGFGLGVGAAIKAIVDIAKIARRELSDTNDDDTQKN